MKNREIEQKITNAFEYTTPNMLDSILADCKSLNREVKPYRKHITSWNIKMACTTAAAILVVCFVLGLGGILDIGSLISHYSTGPQNMIIQYSKESCIAIEDNCFYAKGKKGELYLVRWQDTQELYEGQLVEVFYDTVEKLEYPDGYPSGWTPKYEVTATGVNTYGETIHGQDDGIMCIYAKTIGEIKNGVSYATDRNGEIWKILVSEHTDLDLPAGNSDSGWIYLNGVTQLDAPDHGATYQAASVRIKFTGAKFDEYPFLDPVLTEDVAVMDFDGDGNDEICVLAMGPTSGPMTMQIAIYNQDGSIKYDSIFVVHYDSANTAFFVKDGKLYMIGCCALRYNSNTSLVSGWGYLAIQVALVDGKLKLLDSTGAEWGSIWDGYPVDPEPTDPQPTEPTEPAPTDPTPTEPTEPAPTEPSDEITYPEYMITDEAQLAPFQDLFTWKDKSSFYNMALLSFYDEPDNVNWKQFFYNGFSNQAPITDEEKAALEAAGFDMELDIQRLPIESIDKAVEEVFGLWYYYIMRSLKNNVTYLKDADCYYLNHNDYNAAEDFNAVGLQYYANGAVRVYYTYETHKTIHGVVTLFPIGDQWKVYSNHKLSAGSVVPEISDDIFPSGLDYDMATLVKLQTLFDNPEYRGSHWNTLLCSFFDDPLQIDLYELFYNGFEGEERITAAEIADIEKLLGKELETGITRCPVERMDAALEELFGLKLEDYGKDALSYFVYLESTDCYYLLHGDVMYRDQLRVVGTKTLENGNIEVYYLEHYTYGLNGREQGVVTLKPIGDSYIVISNKGL